MRDSFLRSGDPVNVHPFIEAEKQQGHNVKRACELLKVSQTAFYARRSSVVGPRRARDLELTQEIGAVHAQSHGTYGAPRVHTILHVRAEVRSRAARTSRGLGTVGQDRCPDQQ